MTEKYADKIAKLLRKAEDPSIPQAEAEALIAKAQELMTTYAIDEAMLSRARGDRSTEKIIQASIHYHSSYSRAQFEIGRALVMANDCKALITKGKDLMHTTLWIIGYESDVTRVCLLNASVQIQAMGGLTKWYSTQDTEWYSAREKFKIRRQYLFSFATGLHHQLEEARKRGMTEAAHMAESRGELNAGESVALIVRDKIAHVSDWMNENIQVSRSRGHRFASGGHAAKEAGFKAGQRANASTQDGIQGKQVALNR